MKRALMIIAFAALASACASMGLSLRYGGRELSCDAEVAPDGGITALSCSYDGEEL